MIIKEKCSTCKFPVEEIINIGNSPPANNFINTLDEKATSFPLIVDYCSNCHGIQLRHCLEMDELFTDERIGIELHCSIVGHVFE